MNRLLLFCLLLLSSALVAQVPEVATLKSGEDHNYWLKLVSDAHQHFPKASGGIIQKYGYGSEYHRDFQRRGRERDSLLRSRINDYLDRFGYPTTSVKVKKDREEMQKAFWREMKNITPGDTIQRDSLIAHFQETYPRKLTVGDQSYIVMIVLNTEPNFERRCEMMSILRHEYEEENLSLESMLTYLRDTYRRRFGKELEIPTGTTERERLAMYARELSGCW